MSFTVLTGCSKGPAAGRVKEDYGGEEKNMKENVGVTDKKVIGMRKIRP